MFIFLFFAAWPTTRHPLPVTRYPPPVCPLPATRHPSPITRGKVLPRIGSPKQLGQINARPRKWGLGTVQKNSIPGVLRWPSWERYIICPKPPSPAEKILDRRQLFLFIVCESKFTIGESRTISHANDTQAQQVTPNPRPGRSGRRNNAKSAFQYTVN